jgi:exopolysaccharide biosynthesis WecB/TagA/CpsF family protein
LITLLGSMDFIVGMRYHSLIFSLICGKPFIGIDYDPKVASLLKEIDHFTKQTSKKTGELRKRAEANFGHLFRYMWPNDIIKILGVEIDNVTFDIALRKVQGFINSRTPHIVFTPNPEIIMVAQKNNELKNILNSADLRVPDGIGIVAASRLLKKHIKERVTGIDLMLKIIDSAKNKGQKVFLLGSKPGIAQQAADSLKGVDIAGTYHGYFDASSEKEVIDLIKRSRPDILFVGLGAPRQEQWLYSHYRELGVPVSMVVGGSLDVISGNVQRAPSIIQKLNLEWLYRLSKEPRRWRRQLSLISFLAAVIRNRC